MIVERNREAARRRLHSRMRQVMRTGISEAVRMREQAVPERRSETGN